MQLSLQKSELEEKLHLEEKKTAMLNVELDRAEEQRLLLQKKSEDYHLKVKEKKKQKEQAGNFKRNFTHFQDQQSSEHIKQLEDKVQKLEFSKQKKNSLLKQLDEESEHMEKELEEANNKIKDLVGFISKPANILQVIERDSIKTSLDATMAVLSRVESELIQAKDSAEKGFVTGGELSSIKAELVKMSQHNLLLKETIQSLEDAAEKLNEEVIVFLFSNERSL
jgi:hypothetical protein